MSSLRKKAARPVKGVEVVEMDCEGISQGSGFKTSPFGRPTTQFRLQYDRGERERKVSKYQSKKKVRPSVPVCKEEVSVKSEDPQLPETNPEDESDLKIKEEFEELPYASGDGELCSDQAPGETSPGADEDDILCAIQNETQETRSHGWVEGCEGASDEDVSGDSMDVELEDRADQEMQKAAASPLKCAVKSSRFSIAVSEGDFEWEKRRNMSGEKSPARTSSPIAHSIRSASSASDRRKLPRTAQSESVTGRALSKSPTSSRSSGSSKTVKGLALDEKPHVAENASQKVKLSAKNSASNMGRMSSLSVTVETNTRSPLISTGSGNTKRMTTVVCSPNLSSDLSKQDADSAGKAVVGSSSDMTSEMAESSDLAVAKVIESDSFQSTSGISRFGHSSLLSQLDTDLIKKDILPSIQATGHLGLSSHSETDWDVEEMDEVNEDEDDEDTDVLSLYEYDTFLEGEEDQGERRQGSSLSRKSSSSLAGKPKSGEGNLHLTPEENLSISISDRSERRVSRPGSRERNENESKAVDQKNDKEKGGTKCKEKDSSQPDQKPPVKERQPSPTPARESLEKGRDGSIFQKPSLPALKTNKNKKQSSRPDPRPVKSGLMEKPGNVPQRRYAGQRSQLQPQTRGGHGGSNPISRGPQKNHTAFQRNQQPSREEICKELETELKHFLDKKNILQATETVGKIHQHEFMKINRGLVLQLLHLFIREGAVPQLMRIFTFVCNQGLFNSEVCNAYIRLGCAESKRYDRQLKNIFQYLRRHSIQPAADCVLSLLRLYSEDEEDPMMFWLMLNYFDTFPGFWLPVPVLEKAIKKLLQHNDRNSINKLNHWVLTTKKEKVLQMLDLELVGRMAVALLPASVSRLQKLIVNKQENDELKDNLPSQVETILAVPTNFSEQDYCFFSKQIQDCGRREDMGGLAELYFDLCRRSGFNRGLLKDYAKVLLQKAVVTMTDRFLHQLFDIVQRERSQGSRVDLDELALAHLSALVLESVYFNHHAEMTLSLLDVILECPLVVKRLLMNCRDLGYQMMAICLKCQQHLQAFDIFKAIQWRKSNEQGGPLVKDLLRQLVAVRDIPSASSALKMASSREAMGIADVGILSSQLMWHSLSAGNISVALDLLELGRKQLPPASLPLALLRAVLVASSQSGYSEKAGSLFEELKRRRVYNTEALGNPPYVFLLSTMLTPIEIHLCIMDRLKELHGRLSNIMASRGRLRSMEKGLAIQIMSEHEPQLLALPFLALAPRSVEQAVTVAIQELADLTPPLHASFNKVINLLVVDCVSLVSHLKSMESHGLRQGLVWEDEPSQISPSSVPQPPFPSSQPADEVGRRFSMTPTAAYPPNPPSPVGRQLPGSQVTAHPPRRPFGPGEAEVSVSKTPLLQLPKPVDSVGRHFSVAQNASQPSPMSTDVMGRQVPVSSTRPRSPYLPQDSPGRLVAEPPNIAQPPIQPHDSYRRQLSETPRDADGLYKPDESIDTQMMVVPPDVPPYLPGKPVGRQFSSPPNFAHAPFQPSDPVEQRMPVSMTVTSSLDPSTGAPRRQLSVSSAPMSQPFQQPAREMKRRSSIPPEQPPTQQQKPFKVPLLPTPSLPPMNPKQQWEATDVESSEELPPKKMRPSSPVQPVDRGGRRFQDNRQAPQWQQTAPVPLPQGHGGQVQSQQSSRGRGMSQQARGHRDHNQFSRFTTQAVEEQSQYSRRGAGRRPMQFTHGRGQTVHQTFPGRGRGQPWQHCPGETGSLQAFPSEGGDQFTRGVSHFSSQPSQSSQPLPQQTSGSVGHQFYGEELLPAFSAGAVDQVPTDPEHWPQHVNEFPAESDHWPLCVDEFHAQPEHWPQQPSQHRSWQLPEHEVHSANYSQQEFAEDPGEWPGFPNRDGEQEFNPLLRTGVEGMMQEEELDRRDHSWQGAAGSSSQQQLRAEPWSDPSLVEQRDDVSWRNQLPFSDNYSPVEQAAESFGWSEEPADPFGHQDRFNMSMGPPNQVRGLRRMGRQPFGSRTPWNRSFRRPGGFRGNFAHN